MERDAQIGQAITRYGNTFSAFMQWFGVAVIALAAVTTAIGQDDEMGVGGLVVISLVVAGIALIIRRLRS